MLPFSDGFSYIGDELHCGAVPLRDIAKETGTPAFIYNLDAIAERYHSYASAFHGLNHQTCYAVKANSSLAVLRALREAGCGFDVNSRGELYRAMKAGAHPASISMTGVAKSDADIIDALDAGIALFNSESAEECHRISHIAKERGTTARVLLRINPDVDASTHPYIATGLATHKFGLDEQTVRAALPSLNDLPAFELAGFGMHLGSQIFDTMPFVEGVGKIMNFIRSVAPLLRNPLTHLNIGGGLGVPYDAETEAFPARALADALRPLLVSPTKGRAPDVTLLSEPGRYLVANAGILLARVEYVKRTNVRTYVILDAGMNDLIRPALYEAHHEIKAVTASSSERRLVDVVGPVCESGDTFAIQRRMEKVEPGDLVAIFSAGAYGSTMSSNYNSRLLAAEIAVRDGKWFIARKRQTLEQMMENEF